MIDRWEHIFLQSSAVSSTKKLQTVPDLFSLLRKAVIHTVTFFINPLCLLSIFLLKVLLSAEKYNYIYKYEITSSRPYINQCSHLNTRLEDEKDILNVCVFPTLSWDFRMNPELSFGKLGDIEALRPTGHSESKASLSDSLRALLETIPWMFHLLRQLLWLAVLQINTRFLKCNICLRLDRSRTTHSIVFYHPGFLHGGILNAL